MEKILINWLKDYTLIDNISIDSKFDDLNFDLFDQAMTIDFVEKTFNKNINGNTHWYNTIRELLNDIA